MVSFDEANWNIPQGPFVGEGIKIFTVHYDDRDEIFEYRIITNVDVMDARIMCQQIGMDMPEPQDEIFNEQLRLFWTVDGEWLGNLFLGVSDKESQGVFRYVSNGRRVTYSNWARNEPNNNGDAEDFVIMFSSGKWNDISQSIRTRKTLCLKPYSTGTEERPKAQVLIENFFLGHNRNLRFPTIFPRFNTLNLYIQSILSSF